MENKLNTGTAFRNDYKKEDKHPDFKGTVNIDGKEKSIAIWKREKNGNKYFSIAFSEPYVKPVANVTLIGHEGLPQTTTEINQDYVVGMNDDLPF